MNPIRNREWTPEQTGVDPFAVGSEPHAQAGVNPIRSREWTPEQTGVDPSAVGSEPLRKRG